MAKQEQGGLLFKEINDLRNEKKGPDQDEIDRSKRNDTIFGKIAGSKVFETLTLGVIVLNAGFIGYDADFSARKKKPENLYDCAGFDKGDCYTFIIFENIFAVYFTGEVIIRLFSYKRSMDMVTDLWFVFDSVLVIFMVIETWILPIVGASGPLAQLSVLRLLRLLRITRMAKLMRFFPELQIIVKGMLAAVRSVICTGFLLLLVLYVWAILFTSEFHQGDREDDEIEGHEPEALFGSLFKSMRHLFIMGTILDDITVCCNTIRGSSSPTPMMFAFIVFVLISSFTMLNMLIGILCEVVCATGEGERNKNTEMHVRESITSLFESMDKDKSGDITRDEFLSMKKDKSVMKALEELDVKPKHFEMYADLMFKPEEEGGELPKFDFEKTINMIMRLRPGTKVSALDFASFQMTVYKNHDGLTNHINTIEKMTSMLTGQELGTGSSPPVRANDKVEEPAAKITASTLPNLDKSTDQEILLELQRRLGLSSKILVNAQMQDNELQPAKMVEALQPQIAALPGAEAWSKETYTC